MRFRMPGDHQQGFCEVGCLAWFWSVFTVFLRDIAAIPEDTSVALARHLRKCNTGVLNKVPMVLRVLGGPRDFFAGMVWIGYGPKAEAQ